MRIELLEKVFANVNSWLNFAEAKNALLAGLLVAGLGLYGNLKEELPVWCLNVYLILLLVALIFPLLSFFPFYKKSKTSRSGENLLFYKDIAGFCGEDYLSKIEEQYPISNTTLSDKEKKLCLSYIDEIIINSRIIMYKLSLFKAGLIVTGILVIFCIVMLIVF